MKLLLPTIVICILLSMSCEQGQPKTEQQKQIALDSFSKAKYGESVAEHVKKMTDSVIGKAMLDTVGLYKAPVKILVAKIVKKEYSSFRSVYLQYKNVSDKEIAGIKFRWYGINAFNGPADLGSTYAAGFGGGFTDDNLRPGKSSDGRWDVLSRDAKKIKIAWPIEVSFTDGTSWKIK
jgi:hypothetical protein